MASDPASIAVVGSCPVRLCVVFVYIQKTVQRCAHLRPSRLPACTFMPARTHSVTQSATRQGSYL